MNNGKGSLITAIVLVPLVLFLLLLSASPILRHPEIPGSTIVEADSVFVARMVAPIGIFLTAFGLVLSLRRSWLVRKWHRFRALLLSFFFVASLVFFIFRLVMVFIRVQQASEILF